MTELERAEAKDLYDRAVAQAVDARREAERLRTQADGLEKIAAGLLVVFPDLAAVTVTTPPITTDPSVATSPAPSPEDRADPEYPFRQRPKATIDRVAVIVNELAAPNIAMSVPQVYAEMERRGWLPANAEDPVGAVRVALGRAAKKALIDVVPLDGRSNGFLPHDPSNTSGPDDASGPEGSVTASEGGESGGTDVPDHNRDPFRRLDDHHDRPLVEESI